MNKLNLKVGEMVKVIGGIEPLFYPVTARVTDVDSHPFEYDMVEIEIQQMPFLPLPKCWVQEKYLTRMSAQ